MHSLMEENHSCFDKNIILPICDFWGGDASAYFLDDVLIRYSSCEEKSIFDNRNVYFGSDYKYDLLEKYGGDYCEEKQNKVLDYGCCFNSRIRNWYICIW